MSTHQTIEQRDKEYEGYDNASNEVEEQKSKEINIMYEQNGSTITVQTKKFNGEYNYSFVSVSPT